MAKSAKVVEFYKGRYKGSLSEPICDKIEQLLEMDKNNQYLSDLRHKIYNMADSEVNDLIEIVESGATEIPKFELVHGTLRDEQTIGVGLLYLAGNAILGDSVGLGKTVETAGLINYLKEQYEARNEVFRYLVLTEKNLAVQVRKELVKFTGEFVELVSSGEDKVMKKFVENHDIDTVIPYNIVGTHSLLTTPSFISWVEQCRTQGVGFPFDLLVVDESSCLGNTKTQIVDGYKALAKYCKRIIFLNATPFETKLDIFYTQLSLLDPKLLPTKEAFKKEYCEIDYTGMFPRPTGKYKNQENFKQKVGYRYFARTRREKGAVMEDCEGRVITSPLSTIQKEWLKKTQLNRMVYDCPTALDSSIDFNEINVPKLQSLLDLLQTECSNMISILIFVHFKEAQSLLSTWLTNKGYSNRVLNGDTNNEERQDIIKGFQDKSYRILLTNVQRGLNFGDCNCCIFYSYDPNPSKMIQFEGRTTRSFDIIGKRVYVLCSEGKERNRLDEVVSQRAKATTEMSSTDLSVIMDILLRNYEEYGKK